MQSFVPQSAPLIISATQWSSSNTKPRDLLSCNMVKHLLTTGISAPPYLGIPKPPNLNRLFKREWKKLGPLDKKLKWYVWQLANPNQGSFIFKNYDFQKKYTLFTFYKKKKLPLLLNFTQFYIPGNNSNLKTELIWKTPFFWIIKTLPHHGAQRPNRTQKNS